jgi:hypothetical protein
MKVINEWRSQIVQITDETGMMNMLGLLFLGIMTMCLFVLVASNQGSHRIGAVFGFMLSLLLFLGMM